jgi:hypothetical protein
LPGNAAFSGLAQSSGLSLNHPETWEEISVTDCV